MLAGVAPSFSIEGEHIILDYTIIHNWTP
jgi:hypothetical protein